MTSNHGSATVRCSCWIAAEAHNFVEPDAGASSLAMCRLSPELMISFLRSAIFIFSILTGQNLRLPVVSRRYF